MSTSLATLIRLRAIQNKTRALFNTMDEHTAGAIHHPAMQSATWYLAYGMFMENYFLRDVIQDDRRSTKKLYPLFFNKKPSLFRFKPKLLALKESLSLIKQQQDQNDIWLLQKIPPLSDHPLFKNEYIENYIIQHYAQQYEQLQNLLDQIAIHADQGNYQPGHQLHSKPILQNIITIDAAEYEMGNDDLICDDTERPAHITPLTVFNIASQPVSNAEYLGFIEDDGYQQRHHWSQQGWQWRSEHKIHRPDHWQQNPQGEWYGIEHAGAFDLAGDEPVYGLSYFEACAFASWASARLPHEYEWEAAARLNKLPNTGQVLEWCENEFFYYADFKQLPVMPSLRTTTASPLHVLRGSSKITRPERRRITIRHANNAGSRHIHAGLRLVFT